MLITGKQQLFLILSVVASVAVSTTIEHNITNSLSSLRKPVLLPVHHLHNGLTLTCIGVEEKDNITWFWRNKDDVVEPVVKHMFNDSVSETNYKIIFENKLKAASHLELRDLNMKIYNNTDFICSNDRAQAEYRFVSKDKDSIEHKIINRELSYEKPKLFPLYKVTNRASLICIGINEDSNVTWYWRNREGVIEPVLNKKQNGFFLSIKNHKILFENKFKIASHLVLIDSNLEIFNNTDFICDSRGTQAEYKFIVSETFENAQPDYHTAYKLETASPYSGSVPLYRPRNTDNGVIPLREMENASTLFEDSATEASNVKNEHYLHIIGPSENSLFVGDKLSLSCEWTLPDAPAAWNLEFPNSRRDMHLNQTFQFGETANVFVSSVIIQCLQLEYNNTKVICENKYGRDEYLISLKKKKRLHESCGMTIDCQDANAQCHSGICTCLSPYYCEYGSKDVPHICKKTKDYNDACDYSSQCGEWEKKMTCDRDRCKCARGYVYKRYRCVIEDRNLGDRCYYEENCAYPFGTCSGAMFSKKCGCQQGFVAIGKLCISRHLANEKRKLAIYSLTAVIMLAALAVFLIGVAVKSARFCYMRNKGRHYREVIVGNKQLSISSRLAKHTPSKKGIISQEKKESPWFFSDPTFTTVHLTPLPKRKDIQEDEDKTVCVSETIPFVHIANSSS